MGIVTVDWFGSIPGGEVVPTCNTVPIDSRRFVPRGTGIEAKGSIVPRGTFERKIQGAGVPRETSCILCAILLTFRELGGFWRGLLPLQIKRAVLARQPPQ
jgi:hypothetical protein